MHLHHSGSTCIQPLHPSGQCKVALLGITEALQLASIGNLLCLFHDHDASEDMLKAIQSTR